MKERPILFSGAMVRAILAGRKTQTRRLMKPQPERITDWSCAGVDGLHWPWMTVSEALLAEPPHPPELLARCPYGAPGDRLWVREAIWSRHDTDGEDGQVFDCGPILHLGPNYCQIDYVATPECKAPPQDGHAVTPHEGEDEPGDWWLSPPGDWDGTDEDHRARGVWIFLSWSRWYTKHPSIHMPRWASRITLEVTGVRVERLHAITEEDARAEGVVGAFDGDRDLGGWTVGEDFSCRTAFELLWKDLNGAESWDANPWVWVVEFRRVEDAAP